MDTDGLDGHWTTFVFASKHICKTPTIRRKARTAVNYCDAHGFGYRVLAIAHPT